MAWTHVAERGNNKGATNISSFTITPTATIVVGNMAVCFLGYQALNVVSLTSVTDTGGNTWTPLKAVTNVANQNGIAISYSFITTQLTTGSTITVTLSGLLGATSPSWGGQISEFSGGSGGVDGTPASATGNSTSPASGNTTITLADSILLGCVYWQNPSAFTDGNSFTNFAEVTDAVNFGLQGGYKLPGATGAFQYGGTITTDFWACVVGAMGVGGSISPTRPNPIPFQAQGRNL